MKEKSARYEIEGTKDMVPTLWSPAKVGYDKDALEGIKHWGERRNLWHKSQLNKFSKHNVYSTKKILGVKSVSVNKLHGYGHLEEIVVKRDDRQLYKFKEGDFVDLHLNDIEDMLLHLFKTSYSTSTPESYLVNKLLSALCGIPSEIRGEGVSVQETARCVKEGSFRILKDWLVLGNSRWKPMMRYVFNVRSILHLYLVNTQDHHQDTAKKPNDDYLTHIMAMKEASQDIEAEGLLFEHSGQKNSKGFCRTRSDRAVQKNKDEWYVKMIARQGQDPADDARDDEQENVSRIVTFVVLRNVERHQEIANLGSSEELGTLSGVRESTIVLYLSELMVLKSGFEGEEDKLNDEVKHDKEGDTNDEDDETKSNKDDIYKYKIRVHMDEDEEMIDVEVDDSDKGDEEVTGAAKADAEKTSEVNDDAKKTELPPTSSSLSVSLGFGDQFLKLSFDSSLVSTVKDTTDSEINSLLEVKIQSKVPHIQSPSTVSMISKPLVLTPVQEYPSIANITTLPPPSISTTPLVPQQTTTLIPTPLIITNALTISTDVSESDALSVVQLRVAKLEKKMCLNLRK
ncbi:hypothetical protein Tco_1097096 [Tanacetum coccineum]